MPGLPLLARAEFKRLRALADATIIMPGFAASPQDWLAAFDVSSKRHGRACRLSVLLEAMQAGLPIVASASEGAQHLATQIGTPLVGIDDATALALALRTACATPPARVEYPMARFRIEAKLPQIDAFYRMGLARRG